MDQNKATIPMQTDTTNENAHVISPLVNDKTYGERVYTRVFDWGINYWLNLGMSAAFSQWAEHATRPIKIWGMKEAATPRQLQQKLAEWFKGSFWMQRLYDKTLAEKGPMEAGRVVAERSMSRARSLTLLLPGFFIMIPAVWLGAKIKPAFVEWFNRRHYGDEAMEDPSLKARHQAIAAEEQPTFLGTFIARCLTAVAAQGTAQLIGSDQNLIQKHTGAKNFKGIDPFTEKMGASLGGSMPQSWQAGANRFAQRKGLDWSNAQREAGAAGPYTNALQDFGRFTVADTVYTLITTLLIRPFTKMLRFIPGMSYKPKVTADSATFEGERIKVPSNPFTDRSDTAPTPDATADLDRAESNAKAPIANVSHVKADGLLAHQAQPQIA